MKIKRLLYKTIGFAVSVITCMAILGVKYAFEALAAGGSDNPYNGHEPEETGLITSSFYVFSGIAFAVGTAILATVKAIRSKLAQ
ncbi:hypothetical protein JW710_00230 [Candidatus Dojkabacteria bacterium]|nr:hypothetical protein [Candidatus Dojkabacteria bacterium]